MGLIEFAKKLWADGEAGETPILAAELNRLEDAIDGINETAMTVPVGQSDAGLVFMQNVRFESRIRAGVAGDSTGNNANEWFDLLAATLASEHIDQRYSIPHWNDPTQTWDAATVIQEGTTPTSGDTSVSGTRLEYQQARLPLLFPERLDVLFLSAGHNYQQQTPAELHAAIDSFVADFRALWPGTPNTVHAYLSSL